MNWEALGAIGEFVGAIAVIGSLIYVGVQLRQNTAATRTSGTQHVLGAHQELLSELARDASLAHIMRVAMADFDKLTEDEKVRFHGLFTNWLLHLQTSLDMYERGALEESVFHAFEADYISILRAPGVAKWYSMLRVRLTPAFREYLDSQIAKPRTPMDPFLDDMPFFGVESDGS